MGHVLLDSLDKERKEKGIFLSGYQRPRREPQNQSNISKFSEVSFSPCSLFN